MTPRRAFWQALGLVAIPNLILWSILLSIAGFYAEEWPLYTMFFLAPILILVPVLYHRYKKYGSTPPQRVLTKSQHWFFATLGGILTCCYMASAFHFRDVWKLTFDLAAVIVWGCITIDHIVKALKNRSSDGSPVPAK